MMAVLLISGKLLPVIPLLPWKAEAARQGDTMTAYGPDFHHYCIDGAGANRALIDGDEYTYILPSETLSREETALVFWGMLTLQASFGNVPQVNAVIRNINEGAAAQGVPAISNLVTEADLKLLIHSSAVRGKYSWLSAVLAQEETYLRLAGLLGGTGGGSGMGIPAALQGHTQAGNPAAFTPEQDSGRPGEYVLTFDPSGADAEFIRSVPLKFSSTGAEGSFTPQLPSGWVCQKTDSQIRLTSTGGSGSLYLMFDVRGTRYASGGGTFSSPEEVYEQCLQIWRCSRCAGTHRQMYNGAAPLAAHQRLAFVEVSAPELCYYAGVGGGQVTPEEGGVAFQIYRHEEDWTSTYNVRLRKYDHETGKALENAVFSLYERFDDKDQIHTERDGAAHLYAGGAPYKSYHKDSPVLWEDFRFVSAMMTDGAGEATKTVEHGYHYDKTFCDGHPAPVFVPVPEEEEDEETGEIENQAEIDAAKEENRRLGSLWLNTFASCAAWASGNFSGVHFHWLMPEVDQGEIGRIASSGGEEGETPSAGTTVSAAGPRSFADSGCEADTGETYDRFIALKYSYAITEDTAREGYTLHGNHRDDLPIEVITTDASENGANASFAGIYSHEIRVNDGAVAESARMVRDVRAQAEEGWMAVELEHAGSEATEPEAPRHRKERKSFWQKVFPVFFLEETGEEPLLDDRKPSNAGETAAAGATASNAGETAAVGATASNVGPDAAAVKRAASVSVSVASASDVSGLRTAKTEDEESEADMDAADEDLATAPAQWILKLQFPSRAAAASGSAMPVREAARASGSGGTLFPDAYNRGLNMASSGKMVPPGPSGQYSHCNGRDGEDDWWRIYDHRTEGEIHINKRDLDLKAGENGTYDSYGDSQGDAVLEGAVYGLFAAKDLVHPDGKTGVVYRKNDLVAVASTDKNGDGSFLACTEAPGRTYHYEAGQIENRPGDWNQTAPSNLYNRSQSFDDYTEDGRYTRDYPDYETANGNCWIGRPLLMGDYYVKELSRSEGYELSIGNRKHPWTNAGQDPEISAAETARTGYAVVTKGLYAEQQVQSGASGAYGDPTFRELFFQVNSEKSGGFDLVFSGIPAGSRLYRLDTTVKTESAPIGTGRFTESVETDAWGNPVYVTTEYEGQYPKYDAEGNLLTRNRPVNRTVTDVPRAEEVELDTARCEELLLRAEQGMDEEAVLTKLRKPFARDDLEFVKYKLELILRAHGKGTPKQDQESGSRYTTLDRPVYDTGYQSGAQICFGAPVVTLQVPRTQENGDAVTAGELLAAVLEYYQEHAYLSYGGVDCVEETEDVFEVSVYAGRSGNPECFYVPEAEGRSAAFYLRVPVTPESGSPRYTYAVYTGEDEAGSFGTFAPLTTGRDEEKTVTWPRGEKQEEEEAATWSDRMSAVLVPDAQAEPDGSLVTRCIAETVYYEPGEIPFDASGNRIPKLLYIEETVMGETQKHYGSWTELDSKTDEMVWHAESSYTDVYGQTHWDDTLQQYTFKLVLPGPEQTVLTEEDMPYLAGSWAPGDTMGTAAYYERVKRAGVRAYLDQAPGIGGENSFVKQISLVYPGQSAVWQDGDGRPGSGTSVEPLALEERGIRQRIRVSKTIEKTSYRNTSSYADAHKDWWTDRYDQAEAVDNFRFKVYLKSNLQNLFRDENGTVIWQDRRGNERTFAEQERANALFPEKVNRIYTRVRHRTDPLYKDSLDAAVFHEKLYAYRNGQIQQQASPGYTALLETTEALVEDGEETRTVKRLNYEKFFDAIETANHDKWDEAAPTWTSWRPVGNAVNRSEATIWNTGASDRVRQFAITWYLDDEIAKLTETSGLQEERTQMQTEQSGTQATALSGHVAKQGSTSFSDEILDQGLKNAIQKAQNYLKPFFAYDLDGLYAIAWDEEAGGGADRDRTTLSVDIPNQAGGAEAATEYYGISAMLPYGSYVVVEQQPKYASLEDFKNRHYETDKPKEIELPAVYASEAGAQASPGMLDPFYCYKASDTAAELEKRYQIRFLEESHVIRAHSDRGDFEIYKYGMETDRIRNGAVEHPGAGDYISLTQSEYRPRQNYYNAQDDRTAGTVPYYLSEGQNGREAVSKVYRYSSVSEQAWTADDVWYPGGSSTEDNVPGIWYRDGVAAMQGSQTAYDGRYAPMLVPYSVVREPESGPDSLDYANVRFRNRLYTARLRLEKLDSETHENILHDGAVFRIYAAKRDDTKDGEGRVLIYEEDTQIIGSEEFLTAMGAADIRPVLRGRNLWSHLIEVPENTNRSAAGARGITDGLETTELCTGVVPAGTPVCEESEQILLGDRFGLQTGVMKAFVTVRDGLVSRPGSNSENAGGGSLETGSENVPGGGMEYQLQTVGYLNTPQPLSAGTYVLCETRPPVGYARSKPVALELYSDQVAYYQRGTPDSRVLAAIYEDPADAQTTYKNKPQDEIHTARIYLENEPIRLQVKKVAAQAESGAQNAASPYAAGATMTLFDAISLTPSGDSQDFTYEGLVIERNDAGHIDRMYVKKGYGGEKTEFLPERDDEGRLYTAPWPAGVDRYGEMIYTEGNVWNSVTVMRPDTDILYYDLSDLVLEITPETDGKDGRYQAFAWKGALKFLEFDGGDLTKLAYDAKDKVLTVAAGTHVYHLGRDGARDALVDPYTGMAYVVRDFDGTNGSLDQIRGRDGTGAGKKQVLVWPVNIRRDSYGNILARDKITTFRAALAGAGEEAYLTGSWKSQAGEESHRESTLSRNAQGRNLNEEALLDDNNGSFEKSMDPVYDRHGLVAYYQQSREAYDKAAELYDRNGDFVRSQHSDNLEAYNHAAYAVQEHNAQIDENQALLHRNGEAYVMENTWTTSEQYPNDPFTSVMTEGGGEILERVAAGTYIMEELEAPEGFAKALPVGIAVEETAKIQTVAMVDEPTRTEFSKIDGCSDPSGDAAGSLTTAGENSAFDCGYVKGAVLGLWKTEGGFAGLRGRKMQKEQDAAERRQEEPAECIAEWTTEETPHGITQLPVGSYLWKEIQVPSGFVSHDPVPVTVTDRPELQKFEMKEDHTRVEVEKYCLENGKDRADGEVPVAGAGFTLYPAKLDASGAVCRDENGHPLYVEDLPVAHWTTDDGTTYQEFPAAFEAMYLEHGAKPGSSVAWNDGADLYRAVYESEWQKELLHPQDSKQTVYTYRTEGGARIRIGVTKEQDPLADHLFRFEYQFEWQQLPKVNAYACTYLTLENRQRFDYLPAGSSYVLVETEVPPGFARAKAVLVTVKDTGEVQLYRVENEEGTLLISKVYENGSKELAGARLALYRADEEGGLTRSSRYLFDSWVSGSDGHYTELDAINRRIPQGYAEGDLKPHRIRRLPDGIYWLAEQESPAYYTTFEPVQIVYEWQPEIRILRVNDRPVTGKLILKKTDSAGSPLDGAVFELAAYSEAEQNRCTGMSYGKAPGGPDMAQPVFSVRLTAPAEKTDLPVGEVLENGAICPFWYELREIEAPSGYERNPEVFCWQFAPDTGVVSYPWNGQAQYQITVTDRKTPEPEPPGPDTPEPEKPEPDTPKPKPPEPQKPEETPGDSGHENPKTPEPEIQPVLRIGKILAWYQPSSPDGTGWLYLGPDGYWRMRLPKMGDIRQTRLFAGLFILAAAGLGLAGTGTKCCGGFRGRRRKKKWKK